MLEKTLESPLDCKEIQSVNPKGNQSWIFVGRTDAKAKAPILWPPDVKSWLIEKELNGGKDWREEEKGMTENEMVGWHHWLNGHKFESWWWVGKPGMLVHGVAKSRHDWETELNWICYASTVFRAICEAGGIPTAKMRGASYYQHVLVTGTCMKVLDMQTLPYWSPRPLEKMTGGWRWWVKMVCEEGHKKCNQSTTEVRRILL